MQLGLIGLGKMGGNMAERIRRAGHEVVGYDHSPGKRDVDSLPALVEALSAPRVVWVMVPSGEPTRADGQGARRAARAPATSSSTAATRSTPTTRCTTCCCREKGIGYVDAGVSGGVWGLENGYALMVGGTAEDVAKVQPIFDALKPPSPTDESGQADARRRRLRARRARRRRPLQQDGPQRHRVRDDAGLRRGLRAARGRRPHRGRARRHRVLDPGHGHPLLAAGPAGARAGRGPGAGEGHAATRRTPARAGGPSSRRSRTPSRCRRSRPRCSPASPPARTTRRP